jgi:ABC-type transport system involved in multi-copper enzyme maturation permease subunit
MNFESSVLDLAAHRAVLLREFRAAVINRYFQVFAVLGILAGVSSAIFAEESGAIVFFIMQIALYLVSLLALLAGVSSAQSERSEWPIMFSQPVARRTFIFAKFAAYLAIFGGVLLFLFIPAVFAGSPSLRSVAILYFQTLLLAAAFLALGLTCGFFAHDRAQALIIGISAWLVLLFGIDLIALFAARWSTVQTIPDIWVGLLMLNPLDAFRVHALFALEQIPAEAANKTPLASWWIAHAGLWFVVIAALWSLGLAALATLRLNRWEE